VSGERAALDRTVPAEVTWKRIETLARGIGVTRVADVTWLDCTGICVHQAIRPGARSLSVSQGKGLRPIESKVAATMEAIEVWHAEEVAVGLPRRSARSLSSRLSYDVAELRLAPMTLLTPGVELDWVPARALPDCEETFVPHPVVSLDLCLDDHWSPPLFVRSSDGLASGNSASEAALHGLFEVVEREAVARSRATGRSVPLPRPAAERVGPRSSELLRTLDAAGLSWGLWDCTGPCDLPCYAAAVASPSFPEAAAGFGCHLDGDAALSAAIMEAVQGRVAAIAGSRDDLPAALPRWLPTRHDGPSPAGLAGCGSGLVPALRPEASIAGDVREVVERLTREAGRSPLVVDLTSEMDIPVVKVVAPGLARRP